MAVSRSVSQGRARRMAAQRALRDEAETPTREEIQAYLQRVREQAADRPEHDLGRAYGRPGSRERSRLALRRNASRKT